ncbi:MAG: endonuclease III [Firmicutes bacterium]|nr:endonuclease III [Bacillota bacterium]
MELISYFRELFGEDPPLELNFSNELECIVAIILSAQCTDKRVNIVTKDLFKKYKTLEDYATADLEELEKDIYSTGFYHNKATNIISLCKNLLENHNGVLPNNIDELVKLPGIGRKTASVFLISCRGVPAFPVDTHVIRVSNRLGFTKHKDPEKIERDLKALFDEKDWGKHHFYIVLFGRYHCLAKNPKCNECKIQNRCCYFQHNST